MSRSRGPNDGSIVDSLLVLPWWFSVVLAVVALPGLYFGGGLMMATGGPLAVVGQVFRMGAVPAAVGLLLVAGGAAIHAAYKRRLAGRAGTREGLEQMSWKEFELAVTQLLTTRGYATEEKLAHGPDGGIDVHAWRQSKLFVVQCKHWPNRSVGVGPIRELLGVVTSERAAGGIFVCSGDFTREAREFARPQPIELIDGDQLVSFAAPRPAAPEPSSDTTTVATPAGAPPMCPMCNAPMVMRRVRSGPRAGQPFWGCRRYPRCRGIVNV